MTNKTDGNYFLTMLMVCVAPPVLFLQWLFLGDKFGHGKAIVFVVTMFLFGSAFFFN